MREEFACDVPVEEYTRNQQTAIQKHPSYSGLKVKHRHAT
jgi:hypothetical protein